MMRTTKVLLRGVHRAGDWLVNGYLLHPKRRAKVLLGMGALLAVAMVMAIVQTAPETSEAVSVTRASVLVRETVPEVAPLDREAYLMSRFWLDKLPKGERDGFRIYVFQENSVGAHITVESNFRFSIELFKFSVRNNSIALDFPHARQKSTTEYKIEDHRGPGGLNLRLTVAKDPRSENASKSFYGYLENSSNDLPAWLTRAVQSATAEFSGKN